MTREEAIKRLYELQFYCASEADSGENGCGIWQSDIDALDVAIDALREQPRWISVKDALPEIGVTVLALDKYGHVNSRYMYKHKDGTALFTAEYLVSSKDITHWMPLPKLPEVEV